MIKMIFRLIIILVVGGVLLFLFAPRVFDNAGNSLLAAANSSNAQGLAQLIPAGVGSLGKSADLQVKVDGLLPSTQYEITLDPGQCGGFPTRDLGPISTDTNGSLFTTISLTPVDTKLSWYVDVLQGAGGVSVACGQLQMNKDTTSQVISATSSGAPTPTESSPSVPSSSSQGLPQSASSSGGTPGGLPNTGVRPGSGNGYDNTTYPRKY